MREKFEMKIQQAERGKEIFKGMFDFSKLSIDDTFLLVLTDNEECIHYGVKYLPDFVDLYHKRNVYVLLDNMQYAETFTDIGGHVKICRDGELQSLAVYLDVFYRKDVFDTRMIFLTEKDGHGLYIEELLERGEFTLEEYVAISLYQLKEIKEEA